MKDYQFEYKEAHKLMQKKDYKGAIKLFSKIISANDAPQDLKRNAERLITLCENATKPEDATKLEDTNLQFDIRQMFLPVLIFIVISILMFILRSWL